MSGVKWTTYSNDVPIDDDAEPEDMNSAHSAPEDNKDDDEE